MTSTTSSPSVSSPPRTRTPSAKKKSTSLPPETVDYLKSWMMSPEHIAHPYPTEQEKAQIMQDTGIELKQLTNWFVNNRKRYWKPRVEAQLQGHNKTKGVSPLLAGKKKTTEMVSSATTVSKAISKIVSSTSMASLDKAQQAATTVTPLCSPGRFMPVSEASSTASDAGSVSSVEDVGEQERTVRVDIHILKPLSGKEPTEADMTTLSNIPSDQILRSFKDSYITYTIPHGASVLEVSHDMIHLNPFEFSHFPPSHPCFGSFLHHIINPQEQSRRNAELLRLKKQFLSIYFAEKQVLSNKASVNQASSSNKRSMSSALFEAVDNVAPRAKYRRVSLDLWKIACRTATNVYDESLPSLEEAAQLFGYNSN